MKFFVAIELFISVGATFGTRTLSDGSESADFDRSGVFGGVGARPRAFGWWMERADEKGVKETARHKPLKMLSYVGEYT